MEMVKNLLILALSTFRVKDNRFILTENTYQCLEEKAPVTGTCQLEPVPKYLMREYGLDGILIIETKDTSEDRRPITVTMSDGTESLIEVPLSAEEYFINAISEAKNLNRLQPPLFIKYQLQNGDIASQKDIDNIIANIQTYAKEEENVRIFMDLHGGPRSNAQMMTALFSLLPLENTGGHEKYRSIRIHAEDIYTVIFTPGNNQKNRIVKAGESFFLMDFVAGVHEFVEYGRTESLSRFIQENPDVDNSTKNLINAMEKVSDAIAIGDIEDFETALQELKDRIIKMKSSLREPAMGNEKRVETSDILLRLVDQEYGSVIKDGADLLDQIQWCRDKKFYQQAITLCEARVPWYLCGKGVFDLSIPIKKGYADKVHNEKMREKECATNVFNHMVMGSLSCMTEEGKVKKRYYAKAVKKKNKPWVCFYIVSDIRGDIDKVDVFLRLHCNIKMTRNHSNHALTENQVDEGIKGGINGFVPLKNNIQIYRKKDELDQAIDEYIHAANELIESKTRLKMYYILEDADFKGGVTKDMSLEIFHDMKQLIYQEKQRDK